MEIKIAVQSTPNPNALKFILNTSVKDEGKVTFKDAQECKDIPLAAHLFTVANVSDVHFFENVITVSQDGNGDWDTLVEDIKKAILEKINAHDPNFKVQKEAQDVKPTDPDLAKIDEILERTVRPYLQSDGGDLQLITLDGNILTVNYQGACGSCPSAAMGTLSAIENILKDQFDPEITVSM